MTCKAERSCGWLVCDCCLQSFSALWTRLMLFYGGHSLGASSKEACEFVFRRHLSSENF